MCPNAEVEGSRQRVVEKGGAERPGSAKLCQASCFTACAKVTLTVLTVSIAAVKDMFQSKLHDLLITCEILSTAMIDSEAVDRGS